MAEKFIHRIQCAAITNGCLSFLAWEDDVRSELPDVRLLHLNGWWLDHGRWVCPRHDPPAFKPAYVWRGDYLTRGPELPAPPEQA